MFLRMFACIGLLLAAGCNDSQSPFKYVPVSGRITYEDGTPLGKANMRLQFVSLDQSNIAESHPRPGMTTVDPEGRFDNATSYKFGDGLVPGKHAVAILDAEDAAGKLLVPQEYTNAKSSPLVVDTNDLPFDIKVPKP